MTGSSENPHAGQGSVLLDIGGDVGALVVEMPARMVGVEVEARAPGAGEHVHHPHVAVVNRPVGGGVLPSLVFPELSSGDYGLGLKEVEEIILVAAVHGGSVTTVRWPG